MEDDPTLSEAVARLAQVILREGLSTGFRTEAERLANRFETDEILEVRRLFHAPPREPLTYDIKEHGLGGWLSACQFASFELLFNCGEAALPLLRELAWGEYDWTQGNAIELLVRLAAKGTERDTIVREISANFPDIRIEAQLYAVGPLLAAAERDEALAEVVKTLRTCSAFDEACREMIGEG